MNPKRRPKQLRLAEGSDDTPHYYGHRERLRPWRPLCRLRLSTRESRDSLMVIAILFIEIFAK